MDLRPMLATTGHRPTGGDWAYEIKWDGIRVLASVDAAGLHLLTRNGNDVTARYPELASLADAVPEGTVLDGEIVALDDAGRPSFHRLQSRMHVTSPPDIERLCREVPATLMIFDVLAIGGEPVVDLPYIERRSRLLALALDAGAWRTPPSEVGDGSTIFEWSREHGLEGVVAKRLSSTYRPGRRSPDWVKVKDHRTQELVVGGWLPGEGARLETVGALLLGHWEGDDSGRRLRYAGRVGTGFSNDDLEHLHRALSRIERATTPFGAGSVPRGARFVDPVIVVQVRFAEWTASGVLRAPVFRGVRVDVDPDSVTREE